MNTQKSANHPRRAATLVLMAMMLIVLLALLAFSMDVGYIVLVRTQLQTAADAAAMAAAGSMGGTTAQVTSTAQQFGGYHWAGGAAVNLASTDVQFGTWDATARTFTPATTISNAVRITAHRDTSNANGPISLFFAPFLGFKTQSVTASAVAVANPRDIAFVVDLSGSMNDDTEPCWATSAITSMYSSQGYPTVGTDMMQQVYTDFGFGTYPGTLQYVGSPLGVNNNKYAYAQMTSNSGALSPSSIASQYRILSSDSEATRRTKAYSWIIDKQIAVVMPNAKPTPSSTTNYAYWASYIDYIILSTTTSGGSGGSFPVTPPSNRGTLPPSQSNNTIADFGNPNTTLYSNAGDTSTYQNKIGYQTYVQFMMDFGRDLKPDGVNYTPLSVKSSQCPYHSESTAAGNFSFPPSEQHTHGSRRALIAALQVVKSRNATISDPNQGDWVSIVTFDKKGSSPVLLQSLTYNYQQAMQLCTTMQAVGDDTASTDTEGGMIMAQQHLSTASQGGLGRKNANKVVVLVTDGVPNLYESSTSTINNYISSLNPPSSNFYSSGGNYPQNGPLMQASEMESSNWRVYSVAVGLGADYSFMDRVARMGSTADKNGLSPRTTGNPSNNEQELTDIFQKIIVNPQVRLVQ